jgi:hypothetical protein
VSRTSAARRSRAERDHRPRACPRSTLIKYASRVNPTCVDPAQDSQSANIGLSAPHIAWPWVPGLAPLRCARPGHESTRAAVQMGVIASLLLVASRASGAAQAQQAQPRFPEWPIGMGLPEESAPAPDVPQMTASLFMLPGVARSSSHNRFHQIRKTLSFCRCPKHWQDQTH